MPNFVVCKPYEPDWSKVNECQDQQTRIWHLAEKYNDFYKACHANDEHSKPFQASKPSGTALAKQAADAKQKAEEAKAKARQAADKAAQTQKAAEDEKSRLKAEAVKVPSWCQGMINSCQQRAGSLANASPETQSQCNAYCQTLRFENCNGASATVQGAAQMCNAGAQRDQRQAMEDDKRRKEEQRRREEEERVPPGWSECQCPSAHSFAGRVIRGVRYHPPNVGDCP